MSILDHAINASEAGLKIFPVKPGAKTAAISTWKTDATLDVATIKQWWTENPDYNIGLPTGEANGLLVVDVDYPSELPDWYNSDSAPSLSQIVETPRGKHYYFPYGGIPLGQTRSSPTGVDIHSDGGYVIAVGSVVNGVEYVGAL